MGDFTLAAAQQSPAESYWKKAYELLDDDLRASIGSSRTGKRDVLAAVLKTAKDKRDICIEKRWKVRLPNGEVVIVRDIVEKISRWVNLFIAVGDAAVQYDPASASLPWAAVRFVLQASINDVQVEGSIVAHLETISRLISRYREFEIVYLKEDSPLKGQMEDCLIRIYSQTLNFLAEAIRYFKPNAAVRRIKNVFKLPDKAILEDSAVLETELLKLAGLADSEKLHYLHSSAARLDNIVNHVHKTVDDAKHLQLLKWLSSSPFLRHHGALAEKRLPSSGAWLQQHPQYLGWKDSSSSSLLLLHGIPGSGKSTICSVVVDSFLSELSVDSLATPVAYFYCTDCEFEPERSRPDEVMRSIVRQLTMNVATKETVNNKIVRDIILDEFDRRKAQQDADGMDMPKLTTSHCVKLILEVTTVDPAVIIVDALDEIHERDRFELMDALEQIILQSSSVVKVLLVSRNESQIFSLLSNEKSHVRRIRISPENTLDDMKAYVERELSRVVKERRLLKVDPSVEMRDLLTTKLVAGAGEMFQWVNVQIEHFCQYAYEEDIVSALQQGEMAKLHDSYASILNRSLNRGGGKARGIITRAFSWLLHMKEAMPLNAFLSIVFDGKTINMGDDTSNAEQELVSICSHMILFDTKCDTFRFSHHSIQEFLRVHEAFSPNAAQRVLAKSCLGVCMNGPAVDADSGSTSSFNALYRYCAIYWAHHCSQVACLDSDDADLKKVIIEFVYDEPGDPSLSFITWLDQIEQISVAMTNQDPMGPAARAMSNKQASAVFVASMFGLDFLLDDDLLGSGYIDWNQRNNCGHTSLYLACALGNFKTAQILLGHGADANIECGHHGSALQAACFEGHRNVVQLLLTDDASMTKLPTSILRNALKACFRGQQEDTAMDVLQHADPIRTEDDLDFVIQEASQAGFLRVLEWVDNLPVAASMLNMNQPDKLVLKTTRAIRAGQAGTLATFLRGKADIKSMLPPGPIALAAVRGNDTVVDLLCEKQLDLEEECELGNPLRCATLMGHDNIVRKLVNAGADIHRCTTVGTALQAASMRGHVRIVRFLLRAGADVNQQGGPYGTALQAAAYHGQYAAVETLLNFGARIHLVGCNGLSKDAFHAATEAGHFNIVKLMLDRGYKLPLVELDSGWRNYSAHSEEEPSYQSLQRDAPQNKKTDHSKIQAKINQLCFEGIPVHTRNVFQPLKELGIDGVRGFGSGDMNFSLEVAAGAGKMEVVSMLLEQKGVMMISHDEVIRSLRPAAARGHLKIFQRLLDEVLLPLPWYRFSEALEAAVSSRHFDVFVIGMKKVPWDILGRHHLHALGALIYNTTPTLAKLWMPIATKNMSSDDQDRTFAAGVVRAVESGRDATVQWLLGQRKPLSPTDFNHAFEAACLSGHILVLSSLLEGYPNKLMHREIHRGLCVSASKGHADIFADLLLRFPEADRKETLIEPLIAAAGNGRLEIVGALLDVGDRINVKDIGMVQALAIAAFNGHVEVVRALLDVGVDIDAIAFHVVRDLGRAPEALPPWKHKCCEWPPKETKDYFQAALAGFQRTRTYWDEPSQWRHASHSGNAKVVELLLDHGCECNGLGGQKTYPIVVASEYCSAQVVRSLVRAGADVNLGIDGRNALWSAFMRIDFEETVVRY